MNETELFKSCFNLDVSVSAEGEQSLGPELE